ncbi:MAG: hypothetical protein K6C38_05560, partial [Saccharofermentans sp.]|nr:hypothetical protein [Saccharofermentans sp.]
MSDHQNKVGFSLSKTMTIVVVIMVFTAVIIALVVFNAVFRDSLEQAAMTSAGQSVDQVAVTINNYTDDMIEIMDGLYTNSIEDPSTLEDLFNNLIDIRNDVVMIATYDAHNNNTGIWSNYPTKDMIYTNLS